MDGAGSLRLAKQLRNATQLTGSLFGHDVRTAYQLLARVLQHESGQQGLELAATRDADFHQVGARAEGPRAGRSAGLGRGRSPRSAEGALYPGPSQQNITFHV